MDTNDRKHQLKNRSSIYENKVVANKQKNKIAVGMNFFNQVHFFDLKGNHLKSISVGDDVLPTLDKNFMAAGESYLYCIDLYATNEFVYALWGGQKLRDYESNIITDSYVIVFSWEGNYIKTYKILNSTSIGINPKNTVLFASGISREGISEISSYDIEK